MNEILTSDGALLWRGPEPPLSAETQRAYAREFGLFKAWAEYHGCRAIPADPETVARYLVHEHERGRKLAGVELAVAAIVRINRDAGYSTSRECPSIKSALHLARAHSDGKRKVVPMYLDMLRRVVDSIDTSTLLGKRDRAILLLGFAGAFRRSELAGLDIHDVTFCSEGARVKVRRGKTDQQAKGKVKAIPNDAPGDPVGALRAWLDASGRAAGPLFVSIDRWGNQGTEHLCGRSVADLVKRRIVGSGISPEQSRAYSSHSLRYGLINEAHVRGISLADVAEHVGHSGMRGTMDYVVKPRAPQPFLSRLNW